MGVRPAPHPRGGSPDLAADAAPGPAPAGRDARPLPLDARGRPDRGRDHPAQAPLPERALLRGPLLPLLRAVGSDDPAPPPLVEPAGPAGGDLADPADAGALRSGAGPLRALRHARRRRLAHVPRAALVLDDLQRHLHPGAGARRLGAAGRRRRRPLPLRAAELPARQRTSARPGHLHARIRAALGLHFLLPAADHLGGQPARGDHLVLHPAQRRLALSRLPAHRLPLRRPLPADGLQPHQSAPEGPRLGRLRSARHAPPRPLLDLGPRPSRTARARPPPTGSTW